MGGVQGPLGGPDGQIGDERPKCGQRPAHRDARDPEPAGLVLVVEAVLDDESRAEHQDPGRRGRVECPHRLARPAPTAVVAVDPTPDVAHDRPADQHRDCEHHRPEQRHPDSQQEISLGRADPPGDQRADAHAQEPGERRSYGVPSDQAPQQDRDGDAERGENRGQQAEGGGDRNEDGDRQCGIDQAADATHLAEQRLTRAAASFGHSGPPIEGVTVESPWSPLNLPGHR